MLERLFFNEKPVTVMAYLLENKGKETYITKIARDTNSSYAHLYNLLKKFEEKGLIKLNGMGRKTKVELTEKGEKIAKALKDFKELVVENDSETSSN
ncbi:MAG: winged helix-turn-helix domain-containing protein [archaeon]